MPESYTRHECEQIVQSYLDGLGTAVIARSFGMASPHAVETFINKLAKGYPPASDLFAVPSHSTRRRAYRIALREKAMIAAWYAVQSEFNDPKVVEYYKRHERTKNYQRPTVRYLCEVLKRPEEDLKRYVFKTFLSAGLIEALVCPVPEWK